MFKKWLKTEKKIRPADYKKKPDKEKLELYRQWMSSELPDETCPCCGERMLCGYPAWEGRTRYDDTGIAITANPVHDGMFHEKTLTIVPTVHVCLCCGFTGLFLSKSERALFWKTCCNLDYHES